ILLGNGGGWSNTTLRAQTTVLGSGTLGTQTVSSQGSNSWNGRVSSYSFTNTGLVPLAGPNAASGGNNPQFYGSYLVGDLSVWGQSTAATLAAASILGMQM